MPLDNIYIYFNLPEQTTSGISRRCQQIQFLYDILSLCDHGFVLKTLRSGLSNLFDIFHVCNAVNSVLAGGGPVAVTFGVDGM